MAVWSIFCLVWLRARSTVRALNMDDYRLLFYWENRANNRPHSGGFGAYIRSTLKVLGRPLVYAVDDSLELSGGFCGAL